MPTSAAEADGASDDGSDAGEVSREAASDDDAVEGDTHADGIDAPRTRPADDAAADGNAGADADAGDTGAEPAGDDAAHDAASDGAAAPPDEESRG